MKNSGGPEGDDRAHHRNQPDQNHQAEQGAEQAEAAASLSAFAASPRRVIGQPSKHAAARWWACPEC